MRDSIPQELRELNVWLLWRYEGDKKVPYYASGTKRSGKLDTEQDRAQLVTFDAAHTAFSPDAFTGLGVALGPVPGTDLWLSGIDFDDVDSADPRVAETLALANSYAESSPSGHGLKLFGLGNVGHRAPVPHDGLEIYSQKRFFTVTGKRLNGHHLSDLKRAAERARSIWTLPRTPSERKVQPGGRNNALWGEACRLRNDGTPPEAASTQLRAFNAEKLGVPLPDDEVRGIHERAQQTDRHFKLTDLGNAERLVAAHGTDFRWVHEHGHFLAWDGHYWREDTGDVERLAKSVMRAMHAEAAAVDSDQARQSLARWAMASESVNRIAAAVRLARSEPGITISARELDRDPWLFVTANEVLDLRTGKPTSVGRDAMLTKRTEVRFDADAECPVWLAFLDRVMRSDAAMIEFLQRAVGYTLTGLNVEHCVFFLYGSGANGKTTFLNILRLLLGQYARATETETWMAKRERGVPEDLAALRGIRLAVAAEGEDGQRLSEARIKRCTGGDAIEARKLYGERFNFVPVFKLWFASNHKPQVLSDDDAIWRRIRMVPFTATIPENERDRTLPQRLEAELPGILNWALRGCLMWQYDRVLVSPEQVKAATQTYRDEQDRVGTFLDECCVTDAKANTGASEAYAAYVGWCDRNGHKPFSNSRFRDKLEERGFSRKRDKKGWRWVGLGLLAQGTEGHDCDL